MIEIDERALNEAISLLDGYEEPCLAVATNEALLDCIARYEREIPAADVLTQSH